MRFAVCAALLLLALGGCLGAPPTACPAHNGGTVLRAPDPGASRADPRVPVDELYLVSGLNTDLAPQVAVRVVEQSEPHPTVPVERTEFNATGPQRLERLRYQPADLARAGGLNVSWSVHDTLLPPKCGAAGGVAFTTGVIQNQGQRLTPGHGTHVWYAGFWENGTMFETNIAELDHSGWPRVAGYQSVPYEPLPVYVYDKSRDEQPAQWKPLPGAGPTGTPVDGPAAAAAATPGVGYYSTIKGFNDGLKGLSTTGARVLHLEAKDAYPAGTANNPLAGANLVFYVRITDVVDLPCPTPQPTGPLACPASP
ncbi:MAG: hypothetical protein QOG31_1292 [Thermoplasmata archaeon]|jgi:FKBP-type peptidyl-prolyl cis-trans isomerase 2|nr:hypothetical protein [Thermoplasmata archaeon]